MKLSEHQLAALRGVCNGSRSYYFPPYHNTAISLVRLGLATWGSFLHLGIKITPAGRKALKAAKKLARPSR